MVVWSVLSRWWTEPSCSRCLWWSLSSRARCVTTATVSRPRTSGTLWCKSDRRYHWWLELYYSCCSPQQSFWTCCVGNLILGWSFLDFSQKDLLLPGAADSQAQTPSERTQHQGDPWWVWDTTYCSKVGFHPGRDTRPCKLTIDIDDFLNKAFLSWALEGHGHVFIISVVGS